MNEIYGAPFHSSTTSVDVKQVKDNVLTSFLHRFTPLIPCLHRRHFRYCHVDQHRVDVVYTSCAFFFIYIINILNIAKLIDIVPHNLFTSSTLSLFFKVNSFQFLATFLAYRRSFRPNNLCRN